MRFTIGRRKLNVIKEEILKESFSDKVLMCKKYLDNNFMRASCDKKLNGGEIGSLNVFVQLNKKTKLPTKYVKSYQEVVDILQNKYLDIIGDKTERDGFIKQVVKDWYNRDITKNGTLSSYKFK